MGSDPDAWSLSKIPEVILLSIFIFILLLLLLYYVTLYFGTLWGTFESSGQAGGCLVSEGKGRV